ncbi:hypothetical protein MNBD_ALPHA01-325, partial [hydrothermal vent metagenome]
MAKAKSSRKSSANKSSASKKAQKPLFDGAEWDYQTVDKCFQAIQKIAL